MKETLTIQENKPKDIIFIDGENNEVLKISKGKFFCLGKEIEDTYGVYEKFLAFLSSHKN